MLKNIILSAIIGFLAGMLGSTMTEKTRDSETVTKKQAALEEKLQKLEGKIGSTLTNGKPAIANKAEEKIDHVKEGAESLKYKEKEKYEEAKQGAESLKDKAKEKYDQAKESAETLKGKAKDKVESIKEKAKDKIDQMKEKSEAPPAAKKNDA